MNILEAYQDIRVSDVCDAMDMVGYMDRGLLSPDIRPLYRDIDTFSHVIAGPAMTARYVPTNQPLPNVPPEKFQEYISWWRKEISPSFYKSITKGCVIVIDATEQDVGFIGSGNCLHWLSCGAVGVVTNGGARDTDELIKQKCAVYSKFISRSFKPCRLELESVQQPINCGGVKVNPGDMVVADGDGVICVPQEIAEDVATLARREREEDMKSRKDLYEKLGMEQDDTLNS
jgi:regulator of RNase E activity RraA